jgi:hypothetical protein
MSKKQFYPMTPGGTVIDWLARDTEEDAIEALLAEARHMPYQGWEGFKERGYTIVHSEEAGDE